MPLPIRTDDGLRDRADALVKDAERVMADLKARGGDWEQEWKSHPIAIAYRELLKEIWQ